MGKGLKCFIKWLSVAIVFLFTIPLLSANPGDTLSSELPYNGLFTSANYNFVDQSFPFTTWNTETTDMYNFNPARMTDTLEFTLDDPEENIYFEFPIRGPINSGFGPRILLGHTFHYGLDIDLAVGDTVVAAMDGIVRVVRYERGYGKFVIIAHPNGLETLYGHLNSVDVHIGDEVSAGDVIGAGGNTGYSTGPHLHFEFRFMGEPFDPARVVDFQNGEVIQPTFQLTAEWFRHLLPKNEQYLLTRKNHYKNNNYNHKLVSNNNQLTKTAGLSENDKLPVKQESKLPITTPANTAKISNNSNSSTDTKSSVNTPANYNIFPSVSLKTTTAGAVGNTNLHVIKKGDTLGALAKRYNTTVSKLCQLNNITPSTILHIGKVLRLS
jgi:LysM repeat protein